MNHLQNFTTLLNRYFVLRHGQSESNAQHVIIGDPDVGTVKFGLTNLGRQQVEETIHNQKLLDSSTVIYSSDFLRTSQTAALACELLDCSEVRLTSSLRERYFGEYEGQPSNRYEEIWLADQADPNQATGGVESVTAVIDRTSRLIVELEKRYTGRNILFVSHGDTIQMLRSAFQKIEPPAHQGIAHLQNGELMRLELGSK
jgi:probable phosphoglycerate mutase